MTLQKFSVCSGILLPQSVAATALAAAECLSSPIASRVDLSVPEIAPLVVVDLRAVSVSSVHRRSTVCASNSPWGAIEQRSV